MNKKVLTFGRLLRKAGLSVSLTQISDALAAVALLGFNEADFYLALSSNLVINQTDLPIFNKLFDLYFHLVNHGGKMQAPTGNPHRPGNPVARLTQTVTGEGRGVGAGASPVLLLVQAVREGNYRLLERLADIAVESLGPLESEQINQLEELQVQAKVAIGWYEAVNRLERIQRQEGIREETYAGWLQALQFLEEKILRLLEEAFVIDFGQEALEKIAHLANLNEKDFHLLSDDETVEIRKRINRLGRKLASRYSRRFRRAKNGEFDLRRTVREALKNGGRPLRLKYRRKVISKPDLVLLCDVSGSVAKFSEFMLQLVHTIQTRFRSVRSFLFVDKIAEVTGYFAQQDLELAIQTALAEGDYNYSGFSNIGAVFRSFVSRYLPGIRPRSTLIILGDARNNWNHDEKESLGEIASSVRQLYWLNPQPESTWNQDDSIMSIYAPYCHQVLECRNLRQLEDVIDQIL